MTKPKAIIVDIDGTLSDCEHRRHHVAKKPSDWKAFNEAMHLDKAQEWCVRLVRAFRSEVEVFLVTGREIIYQEQTHKWLIDNGIPFDRLVMRPEKDYRKDCDVKEEILKRDILPNFDVLFCVDDRKQVVDMWRRNGLVCLQCAEGDF